MKLRPSCAPWGALLLSFLPVPAVVASDQAPYSGPVIAGEMEAPPRHEASGVAASRRSDDLLWTHDDSGGEPVLYGVSTTGKLRGAIRVTGVRNEDWEDIAAFVLDGKGWLLVGDIGDNNANRKTVQLHLVEEPPPDRLSANREISVAPAYSLRIRYEDGPRDCESVAVDVAERTIYLMSKRDSPPRLYRLPLAASAEAIVVAKFVGVVPHVALLEPDGNPLLNLVGRFTGLVTAMDFADNGFVAVVLTYSDPVLYTRQRGESWPTAFARTPVRLAGHGLPQAEGVCFSPDGRFIYVVSERLPRLLRYDRRETGDPKK